MIQKTAFLTLCTVCIFAGEVKAKLFLEEGKVVLAVSGGDRVNKSITVNNTSVEGSDIRVYWEDFQYKAPYEGTKDFLPSGTLPGSAGSWITFSPQTFTLPAFGKQQLVYTINVPAHTEEGHYGVLFFEKSEPGSPDGSGVKVVTRVGCLFFIEPKDKIKKAVVQDFKLAGQSLTGNFINQGNVILIPRTTYYIMDGEGLVTDRGEIKKLYVPPNASAPFEIVLPKGLKTGQYTLVINADLEEGDVIVKETGLVRDASGRMAIEE